jgi:hypothetical protein
MINDGYMGLEGHQARANTDVDQFVRFLDAGENNAAGQEWNDECAKVPP